MTLGEAMRLCDRLADRYDCVEYDITADSDWLTIGGSFVTDRHRHRFELIFGADAPADCVEAHLTAASVQLYGRVERATTDHAPQAEPPWRRRFSGLPGWGQDPSDPPTDPGHPRQDAPQLGGAKHDTP